MGVEFMQSNSLYSQLFNQVGSLLHEANCHHMSKSLPKHGEAGGGGGGYFKHLLEGEEPSITSSTAHEYMNVTAAAEDTKPLSVRSLEITGLGKQLAYTLGNIDTPPPPSTAIDVLLAAPEESPCSCTDSKPSCTVKSPTCLPSTSKRGRESSHMEETEGPCKKEKKAGEDKEMTKGKKGGQQGAALMGRKASSAKAKAPKPTPHLEAPKLDYVHVRARRGQATDSHSLAERVRREKISERMRFLQDLVPGCSKITGKALVLDEIINYVQSLQNQVEFLAMRLSAIYPKVDHLSFQRFSDEEIASPFMEEAAANEEHVDMLPKTVPAPTPTSCDLHFESLPQLYSSFFEDANFNASIVSDLSTSTCCNDSNITNMDFSHLS